MSDRPRFGDSPERKQSRTSEEMVGLPDTDEAEMALRLGTDPEEFRLGPQEKAKGAGEFHHNPETAEQSSREKVWREQLSPEQLQRQQEYDRQAADKATRLVSRDPYVKELACQIEEDKAGRVLYINRVLVNPAGGLNYITDYDIETDKVVIQVKSGTRVKGMGTQMTVSSSVSDKVVIGYAPEASPERLARLESQGHLVFTDLMSLISHLKLQ